MSSIKEALFEFTVRRPFLVILALVVIVMGVAYGGSKLTFKSDYRVFFGEENPQLTAFENMQATFTKNDNVAFIIAPKDGVVFKEETLKAIHTLTNDAWQIPYTNRVDSVTNYQHTTADGDDLFVEDLVLELELLPELNMDKLKAIVLSEPVLYKKLISDDASVTVVNATVQLPGIDPVTELPAVVIKVREIQKELIEAHPELDIYLSGMTIMNNTFSESALNDSSTLVPIMFGVVALGMTILLRTISGSVATIIVVMFSIVSTMGLAGWLGFFLTGPSASAPTIILTLAVADCIHILTTMLYEMRQGVVKRMAIVESLRINFQPILLTSITTAIGFLSMNFSDSPPFNDLGNLVAIGVMSAFLFSITLFPALLSVLPIRVRPKVDNEKELMDKLAEFVIKKRKILLPSSAILIVGLAAFVPQNELNDNFVEYFDESVPFRQASDFMQERMSGLMTQEIEVNTKESSGINKPAYLSTLATFSDWLREQPETDNVNILSDVLKRLNKNMHGDDPSYYGLPEDRELSAQYLLLYELSLPYGLDLNNQIDVDKAASRIVITTKNLTSTENIAFEKRMKVWFIENTTDYTVHIASPTLMFAHIGQRNIQSMLIGTSLALILISLLLGVALRSIKFGAISLIPNLIPAAMGFGAWYFIDGQIGLALSVVTGMTLGIVVDDTVHFLSKYLRAKRDKNKTTEQAVRYAFASVGKALWITTLVLIAGFMVLAQSSFKLNADMGLLTAITIGIALMVDFLFLPPLLMLIDKDKVSNIQPDAEPSDKGEKQHAAA
ncbi:MAG: putative RND superfamily exporter protein [Cellvibrionaceae bacterium]|jgi:predicted RND superfamily exporter protein